MQKQKSDLMKLQSSHDELSTTANINMQKLNEKLIINQTLCEEKEGLEKKLVDSIANNESLQEQVVALTEEMKKAEGSKKYYLDKISKLESGDISPNKLLMLLRMTFFTSESQRNT